MNGCIGKVIHRIHRPSRGTGTRGREKLHRHHLNGPVHTGHAHAITTHGANRAGHMRTMAMIIKWVIVIIGKIPADQIVTIAIAIIIQAIFPTPVIQQITSINAAIAIVIHHIGSIGGAIQIAEGDQAISINIGKAGTQRRRNFALI